MKFEGSESAPVAIAYYCGIIGAIIGAIIGFIKGGIGGAIAGLLIGAISGAFAGYLLFMAFVFLIFALPWLLIIGGFIIIIFLINDYPAKNRSRFKAIT